MALLQSSDLHYAYTIHFTFNKNNITKTTFHINYNNPCREHFNIIEGKNYKTIIYTTMANHISCNNIKSGYNGCLM